MIRISRWLFTLFAACTAGILPAQGAWPDKPIHLLVGFPPGSQPDIVARLVAQELGKVFETPVLVENVTGAAGNIAADRLAKAAPDGYTVGLLSQTHLVINPALYALPYDPLRDFAPITRLARSPNVLVVNTKVPANTLQELVALAKSRPGELTFASSGTGSGTHMAAELFKAAAGVDVRHIPYKGVVAAIPDLLGGRISMMFSPIPVVLPLVREGKLRALAVTSLARSTAVPDLPTIANSGYPGFEATNWYGLLAPARTPDAIVQRLHRETVKAIESRPIRDKLTDLGLEIVGNSPQRFAAEIRQEIPEWRRLIEATGMKSDR